MEEQKIIPHLRTHIIPVGFEYDRVILGAERQRADRIYLITRDGNDRASSFVENAQKYFIDNKVVKQDDLIVKYVDIYDFDRCMELVAEIFKKETDEQNNVSFNVSSGGHILSLVGMLSCLLFNGNPYYCEPETYNNLEQDKTELLQSSTSGLKRIIPIPTFTIEKPPKELILFLIAMQNRMDNLKVKNLSKSECLELFNGLNLKKETNRNSKKTKKSTGIKSGDYNSLKFGMLEKLEKRNYIINENKPRGRVSITQQGYQAINIFAKYYNLSYS